MKPSQPAVGDMMRRMKKEMPALHYVEHRLKSNARFADADRRIRAKAAQRDTKGSFKATVTLLLALLCPALAHGAAGTVPAGGGASAASVTNAINAAMVWTNDGARKVFLVPYGPTNMFFSTNGALARGRSVEYWWGNPADGDIVACVMDVAKGDPPTTTFHLESIDDAEGTPSKDAIFDVALVNGAKQVTLNMLGGDSTGGSDSQFRATVSHVASASSIIFSENAHPRFTVDSSGNSMFAGTTTSTNGFVSLAGQSVSNAYMGGTYFQQIGTAFTNLNATPGTSTNLATVSVAGHTLTNSGDRIAGEWGVKLRNAFVSSNQFQIFFGSTTLLDSGMQSTSNNSVRANCTIARTGNTSAHVEASLFWGPGTAPFAFTNANIEIAETNGIATVLGLKGASSGAGSMTNNYFTVEWKPASR